MLRIYNALSIIDPLPGLGVKVVPEAKKVEDPIKAFNEGNHKPLTRLSLPPPFCKKEAKKAKLATEYASGKLEADVNKAQAALVTPSKNDRAELSFQEEHLQVEKPLAVVCRDVGPELRDRLCICWAEVQWSKPLVGQIDWICARGVSEVIALAETYQDGTKRLSIYSDALRKTKCEPICHGEPLTVDQVRKLLLVFAYLSPAKPSVSSEESRSVFLADLSKQEQDALAVSNVKGLPEDYLRRLIAEAQRNARER